MTGRHNDLIHETSPYLLQHAHNPVDWHGWNRETLELARKLDRPILLSIGYSACHWCHVMERESFEDPDTARYMNDNFVCIKVDREERPDLDKIYQIAHQMLTQRAGGWPLNVAIAPDTHAPFFAGTYFPNRPRYGMPSFRDVLARVAEYFHSHRGELTGHAEAIKDAFRRIEPATAAGLDGSLHEKAIEELSSSYDSTDGGFGSAPKFPHPTTIALCLTYWAKDTAKETTRSRALQMARHTLEAMAGGGMYDQLGGGFYRYSVDKSWTIPHFEKMLYDNAQLLPLYVDAWQACGDDLFRTVALGTASWVIREMQSPAGGYYSTLDADSEGEEGKYYVWDVVEMRSLLTGPEFTAVETRFGLKGTPNFEGKWHLNIRGTVESVAEHCARDKDEAWRLLQGATRKLLNHRSGRLRPQCDDKILTSWNGLMIGAMAHAGRILEVEEFISSAEKALDYVRNVLWSEGRLRAAARNEKAHLNAYLDDYVFLVDGIIELCQARWRGTDLEFAIVLADAILQKFEDAELGGLYFTSDDHEELLHRTKTAADEAIPSGNGTAARVLLRLGHLLGERRYLDSAERILRLLSSAASRQPSAHGSLVMAANELVSPPSIVIIRGEPAQAEDWARTLLRRYLPGTMVMTIANDETTLPGILGNLAPSEKTTAYVCRGTSCSPPITSIEEFTNRV